MPGGILARIRDGEVIALYYLSGGGDVPSWEGPWTIPGQFERIQGYIDGGARSLEVEYDPQYGVPTSVAVDPIPNAVDDEHGFTITVFGDIPVPAGSARRPAESRSAGADAAFDS